MVKYKVILTQKEREELLPPPPPLDRLQNCATGAGEYFKPGTKLYRHRRHGLANRKVPAYLN